MQLESRPSNPLQPAEGGYGPHFIRRYSVIVKDPRETPEGIMRKLKEDLNSFSPQQNACFTKTKGEQAELRVGDEFAIRICGPNDGTVVVTNVDDLAFTLHTLEGHPEAGAITFSAREEGEGVRFQIESHARSKDMLVHLMYHTAGIGKMKQQETWAHFCNAVALFADGDRGEVQVTTYRCDDDQMTVCTFEELGDAVDEGKMERLRAADESVRQREASREGASMGGAPKEEASGEEKPKSDEPKPANP